MPVHPLSLFPEIMEFEKQQNVLDCTTLLLAILASEETELQEKALVLQPNSCMGRSKTTSHDDLGVMDFEDTTQKSSSIAVRPLDVSLQDGDSEQSQDSLDSSIRAVNSRIQSQVSA
ncbi:hypothetical protein D5086_032909 [Populus alba]|uniref:Uncharacterized protein n=1 Tax=Populus alba TaxID=43335 RepID=A0ACC4AFC0_POPAL